MTVPFQQIPANLRVPLFYAEIDPSRANSASVTQRALLIGQKTTGAGTLAANVPALCQSQTLVAAAAGAHSMLADMFAAYRKNDPVGEVWMLPLADDPSAAAATGSVTFGGSPSANGVVSLYVAGSLVAIAVSSGMTAAQIATAAAAAINALPLVVGAAVDGTNTAKVNLTALNAGLAGNDIDLRLNYLGPVAGEALPAGVTATLVQLSAGTVNPALTTALANLLDQPFDFIVSPYTDATSTAAVTALLNDVAGRWSWSVQVYGHCFIARRGSQGSLASFGTGLNDQHLSCVGFNDSPSPNWRWAAALAGAAAVSLRNDPGQPLQTLPLLGVLAPPLASRFMLAQRNVLLYDGISTFKVDRTGLVSIENIVTTYQSNPLGQPDDSYLEVETMFVLTAVLRRLASVVGSKYARKKLAANGTRLPPGSNVVTPNIIRADLIAEYRAMEAAGLVQLSDVFAAGITVEKNVQNPNRVDVLYPAILINQLRVFALLAQFRLS